MNLFQKSQAVQEVFRELEEEAKVFHEEGGMGCVSGCGFCCANPKVPASPLEFLPLAFDLYEKGLADEFANKLAMQDAPGICIVYKSLSEDQSKGFCGSYVNRGLICRLFGASARRNSKTGKKELITCKILKAEKQEPYQTLMNRINQDMEIPMAPSFYTRLNDIDEYLSNLYPINQAILMALELVLRYKFYQESDSSVDL